MSYRYAFREVGKSLIREPGTFLAPIVTLGLSLLVFNSFLLVTLTLKGITDDFKRKMEMEVYLGDDLKEGDISLLASRFGNMEQIEEVVFKSKDEALEEAKRFFKAELLQGLETNPLPASFSIKLKKPYKTFVDMEKLSMEIMKFQGVEGVEYGKEWARKIDQVILAFLLADIFFGLLIATLVMMIVAGNVRNMIGSQKESIHVVKLLGADSTFITRPLFLQGLIQGGLAGTASLLLLYLVYLVFISNFFKMRFLSFDLALSIVLCTLLLGGVGSLFAIRKYV